MLKIFLVALLPFLAFFSNGSNESLLTGVDQSGRQGNSGILEKMIVANGNVAMNIDLSRLNNGSVARGAKSATLNFDVEHDSFFTVLVLNGELRGPIPGSMALIPQSSAALPAKLNASMQQLVLEAMPFGESYELAIRDAKSGFVFFNIEGHNYDYNADQHALSIPTGRLLISKEFAAELGRPSDTGTVIGQISLAANMRDIEISQVVNDQVTSDTLPAADAAQNVAGPDVIVGDLTGLSQPDAGATNNMVGLSVGTVSCNLGTIDLDWFQTPDNDHPVIPQNMYRMSGGATNDDRFEQIGQSSVKHAFTALTENLCSTCSGVGGTHLGVNCSDPYVTSLNSGGNQHTLGSRAWINPFTGSFPRADTATPPNSHTGHTHTAASHRILVNVDDLNTSLNAGATYYAEAMYVTPHEYVWCQAHAGQCNQYNNVSYRRWNVTGTTQPFSFQTGGFTTQRAKTAISAWTGATLVQMEPDPGNDGIGTVAYKVTNPSPGVWHYEYAVYNQNMDRAIQSFSIPEGAGVTLSNVGFHAPPQQPGWAGDGTAGNAGFSNAAWAQSQAGGAMTWNSETLAQNANANAIRWGTMYNFRFDSNRPPQAMNATVGFFKTGAPITVAVQGPSPDAAPTNATVSGRVFTSGGIPIRNAAVVINDQEGGHVQVAITSSLGFYVFDNVLTGASYTIGVSSKRYTFNPVTMPINGNLADVDLTAQPDAGRMRP